MVVQSLDSYQPSPDNPRFIPSAGLWDPVANMKKVLIFSGFLVVAALAGLAVVKFENLRAAYAQKWGTPV